VISCDTSDDMRIIAQDAQLARADRERIRCAADELDKIYHMFISTQNELIMTNQKLIALNEVLIELKRKQPPAFMPVPWTVRFGPAP
jgi:hypothetical protein